MMREKNECIARKGFASLILDYEFSANDLLPAYVSCRVLIDGWYNGSITAESREAAIEKFYAGEWRF